MSWNRERWMVWTPRVLTILFTAFISIFALDVFVEGRPWMEILGALLIHLIPTYLLILLLLLAWRRPWIGALGYAGLAVAYAALAWRHPTWILGISGPLLVMAGMYWLSWQTMRSLRRTG